MVPLKFAHLETLMAVGHDLIQEVFKVMGLNLAAVVGNQISVFMRELISYLVCQRSVL